MAGTKRKRQKVDTSTSSLAPLGSSSFVLASDTDAAKDDEERELESRLFGKSFVPSTAAHTIAVRTSADGAKEQLGASSGLDHVLDEDVSPAILHPVRTMF
jgi:hypothetical protein